MNHRIQLTEHLSKILACAHVLQLPKDLPFALLTSGYLPAIWKDRQAHPAREARRLLHLTIWKPFTHLGGSVASLFPWKQGPPSDFKSTLQHSLNRQASYESWKSVAPLLPHLVQHILFSTS